LRKPVGFTAISDCHGENYFWKLTYYSPLKSYSQPLQHRYRCISVATSPAANVATRRRKSVWLPHCALRTLYSYARSLDEEHLTDRNKSVTTICVIIKVKQLLLLLGTLCWKLYQMREGVVRCRDKVSWRMV